MKDLFLRTLLEAFPFCRWRLEPRYTIGLRMEGKAMVETNIVPMGKPCRIWGTTEGGIRHTPASLVATAMGYPIEGGMFSPEIGRKLGFYPYQGAVIVATCEGRTDHPSFDPEFRGQILSLLGLHEA